MTRQQTPFAEKIPDGPGGGRDVGRSMWHTVNISIAERLGRVGLGLAAIVTGIILQARAGSLLAVLLEALLIAAGLDILVTGGIGHCPLYQKLGRLPRSLREPR